MDICEVHSPMTLVTASMDKKVRLFNLLEKGVPLGVIQFSNIRS
jgi:hypothetical protein